MSVTLEEYQLQNLLTTASTLAVKRVLLELGLVKTFLSKTEAYKLYGRGTVERWISEGLIKPHKDGSDSSKVRLERMRLEALSASSNRTTYLPTNERN